MSVMVDPGAFTRWLGVSLLVLGGLVAALPVGTCSQCNHCREERLRNKQARRARDTHDRLAGQLAACPRCGRSHDEDIAC